MSVLMLDGSTIRTFVEDEEAFAKSIKERFTKLDIDADGLLSHAEMNRELRSLRVFEKDFGVDEEKMSNEEVQKVYNSIFDQFDHHHIGSINLEDFQDEMKKVMLAVANGLGLMPINMVLEEDSFLIKAVERESSKTTQVV